MSLRVQLGPKASENWKHFLLFNSCFFLSFFLKSLLIVNLPNHDSLFSLCNSCYFFLFSFRISQIRCTSTTRRNLSKPEGAACGSGKSGRSTHQLKATPLCRGNWTQCIIPTRIKCNTSSKTRVYGETSSSIRDKSDSLIVWN